MAMTERQLQRNQDRRRVTITEVNTANRQIHGKDQFDTPIMCDISTQGVAFQIPVAGEVWTAFRRGNNWVLDHKFESPNSKWPISALHPGDVRVDATGTIYLTTDVYIDGNLTITGTGGGGGAVSSVFGRTGVVVATSGDYSVGQITGAAPLASPTFTGTPAAPTPATVDNSTKIATTAFVKAQGYLTSAPVTSVFTRTGAVVATSGDYSLGQITAGTNHALAISTATTMTSLPTGNSGYVLVSGGAGADPTWVAPTTIGVNMSLVFGLGG